MIQTFAEVKLMQESTLIQCIELNRLAMCNEKELPVKVEAAMAIQSLLASQEKGEEMF